MATRSLRRSVPVSILGVGTALLTLMSGCAAPQPASQPASAPAQVDTTLSKEVAARDRLERQAAERAADFQMVDRMVDKRTPLPLFERQPLAAPPPDARVSAALPALNDTDPFAPEPPLPPRKATIVSGVARSTFRTREPAEVMAAVQPFLDQTQRDVNVRATVALHERPEEIFHKLAGGQEQLEISHVFDYLLVRAWLEDKPGCGAIPLSTALPAHPRTTPADAPLTGLPGTSIELLVRDDSKLQQFADLKGARLALAANYVDAPGAFLTGLLLDQQQPAGAAYFGELRLRRYSKDALLDLVTGKADVACVDQGTVSAVERFYGLAGRFRAIAVSPRYNFDVLYSSENNLEDHRTEIELTQRQLTTLAKSPEGQEVLYLFDIAEWRNYEPADWAPAREHFADFLKFWEETPLDLKPLLDPHAQVERQTYDLHGDE